ncbi:hypothetical protein FRC10_009338 [Ceratobasidium sp. 414]|nr:hypothetical protein FRC10_009338 [Ceratobasidium sp. 414]
MSLADKVEQPKAATPKAQDEYCHLLNGVHKQKDIWPPKRSAEVEFLSERHNLADFPMKGDNYHYVFQ